MVRAIEDKDYISFLPTELYRRKYYAFRDRVLNNLDEIIKDFRTMKYDDVVEKWNFTPKEVALLVRLKFLTEEEVTEFNLWEIEQTAPL